MLSFGISLSVPPRINFGYKINYSGYSSPDFRAAKTCLQRNQISQSETRSESDRHLSQEVDRRLGVVEVFGHHIAINVAVGISK